MKFSNSDNNDNNAGPPQRAGASVIIANNTKNLSVILCLQVSQLT